MLSRISQAQKDKCHMVLFLYRTENIYFAELENEEWLPEAGVEQGRHGGKKVLAVTFL